MKNKFPYRYRVLILLFFLIVVTYLDRSCIGLVAGRIKSDFHLNNSQWGWVVGAFALAYALFEIPSGTWGDRIGQRATLIRIVICWSIFTALTGVTTGLLSLVIVRFLFGMGEAGAFPNSCGVVYRWFPANETSRGLSSTILGVYMGSAVAPLIVIPIAVAFGWRTTFFVNGFIGLIWVLVCFLWFRNNPSEMKGITDEEKNLIEKNRRVINHKLDFPWGSALKSRSMRALSVSYFCSQACLYFFIGWFAIYLQEGRHFTESKSKTILSFFYSIGIGGALAAGFLNDWLVKRKGLKFGRRLLGMLPLSIFGLCFLIAGITANNFVALTSLFLGMLFYPSSPTASFSTCVDIGANRSGTVAGIMNFCGQMGAFFSSIAVGIIADLTHSYNTPMFLIAGLLLGGSLFWLLVDPTKQIITKSEPAVKTEIVTNFT
jgi:ACS family glucarate transporter-like MFS transporter